MLFKRRKRFALLTPVAGQLIRLEDVPDPVFSEKMMGDGFAVDLLDGKVVSPVKGIVEVCFPTGHAIGLKSDEGVELLIHLGIDTVKLNGSGFHLKVAKGDSVEKGDLLVEIEQDKIRESGFSLITPVIITSGNSVHIMTKQSVLKQLDEVGQIRL